MTPDISLCELHDILHVHDFTYRVHAESVFYLCECGAGAWKYPNSDIIHAYRTAPLTTQINDAPDFFKLPTALFERFLTIYDWKTYE